MGRKRTKVGITSLDIVTINLPSPSLFVCFNNFSLIATIKEIRPELFDKISDKGLTPIPKEIPPSFFEKTKGFYVDDIGIPTAATFLTLTSVDPTNWYLFNKRKMNTKHSHSHHI